MGKKKGVKAPDCGSAFKGYGDPEKARQKAAKRQAKIDDIMRRYPTAAPTAGDAEDILKESKTRINAFINAGYSEKTAKVRAIGAAARSRMPHQAALTDNDDRPSSAPPPRVSTAMYYGHDI